MQSHDFYAYMYSDCNLGSAAAYNDADKLTIIKVCIFDQSINHWICMWRHKFIVSYYNNTESKKHYANVNLFLLRYLEELIQKSRLTACICFLKGSIFLWTQIALLQKKKK